MPREKQNNKKWHAGNLIAAISEIVFSLAVVIIVCFVPNVRKLNDDVRLSIIELGLVAPIVILRLSVNAGQNKIELDVQNLTIQADGLDEKLQHISPMLEKVFVSGNDRVKRFVFHRVEEINRTIQSALSTMNSGELTVSEYYDELNYLADLIVNDKKKNSKEFKGEIWAMTSFAPDEWSDEGYEKAWTSRLKEMVDKGIKTRRLCIIPRAVQDVISKASFQEPADKKHSYFSFFNLLCDYYREDAKETMAMHYCVKEGENQLLENNRGFFAIKLTNGELHILTGETVNVAGALTAKMLFNPAEIKEIRERFDRYTRDDTTIGKFVHQLAKSDGFIQHLEHHKIKLTK